jgi:hypothetical protein
MSKMGSHDPFGHFKHKLWPKERSGIAPISLRVGGIATYHWKALDEGYNFASYLTSIKGLHVKLWASKVARVPTLRISRLPLGSLGTK